MPDRTETLTLLAPVDDVSDIQLPPRFSDALAEMRIAIERCDEAGLPGDTVLAASVTALMPRLVDAHGPNGATSVLSQLAREISA